MARKIAAFILAAGLFLSLAAALPPQAGYDALKAEAERFYAEKSFSRAHELYAQAAKLDLPEEERRWVRFRVADTAWRGEVGDREEARKVLEAIIAEPARDRVWAEANESLGDFHRDRRRGRGGYSANNYYLAALDWWAGSDQIELARRRYLAIVFRMTEEPGNPYEVPEEIRVNAVEIAQTPQERARARFLLAVRLLNGQPESIERALEHLEAIIAEGKKTEWYDDALFLAAQQLSQQGGQIEVMSTGEVEYRAQYERALEYYRRILREFRADETRYHDDAERAIQEITAPGLDLTVRGTFLPESEQQLVLSWRNVKAIDLAVYAVDLGTDIDFRHDRHWTERIRIEGKTPVRKWTFTPPDRGPHVPDTTALRVDPKLPPGAYVVTASSGTQSARTLLLVTDAHILVHAAGERMQVFVSSVLTGEPIANARVTVWQQSNTTFLKKTAQTDANGLASFEKAGEHGGMAFVTASAGAARQAWVETYRYWPRRGGEPQWRIYAFTDRPAYRPDETVQWKIIARTRDDDRWSTPADQALTYEITSPRGEKVAEGKATLNAFGSFWGELPLTTAMPLGAYTITFRSGRVVGSAQLFRLEEYKLPEFEVRVTTPEGRQYRLGDTIEAQIEANYYFGGPVANATVEAVVYRQAFHRPWHPWRKYPWYFPEPPHHGGQEVLRRETLTTDANGRAVLRIATSRDWQDTTFRIEARVIDASRREVTGAGSVRVMRQRYSVSMRAEHLLHRPGEQVSVEIRAIDANDQPVQTTGTVTVVRRTSREDEEILSSQVKTNARGEATFTFTPKREGYYVIRWHSVDTQPGRTAGARDIVTAETAIWVAERRTIDLGWHHTGGLDLVVDKESFRAGEKLSAIVVTPASGRWVMVTASGDDIIETQVVRLDGTVKLLEFSIDERHSPNFFLTASSVFDREVATDTERVVVPPIQHFLDVEVATNRDDYRPRDEGQVTITTRDADGKPVSAEVALAVSDEAVTAIQQDPAGDPRQFFFGDMRHQPLMVAASLHSQRYVKLTMRDGQWRDADAPEELARDQMTVGATASAVRQEGRVGAKTGMPPPPPAPVPPPAVAEGVAMDAVSVTPTAAAPQMAKEEAQQLQVEVRSDFRSTAFWKPDIVTDAGGKATVTVKFPEALTQWRATARAVTTGAQAGMGSDTARTNLPLIVRLQAPRFFVTGDKATISAVINNNTDAAMSVTPAIEVKGLTLRDATRAAVSVPAHGEARADWVVSADVAGTATVRVTGVEDRRSGLSGQAGLPVPHGDAMEKTFVVYEHGIDKLVARSGKVRADEVTIRLDLPPARRATTLAVNVSPTLANTMIEALPYLLEFPYGCTEQTMSRFLPAAVVARTGLATGIRNLDEITRAGMARLYDMQHADGGWGWWKESPTDDWMTAYVVWGFSIARDAGLPVDARRVDRAAQYLARRLVERELEHNHATWMLHALGAWRKAASDPEKRAFEKIWTNREKLSAYSKALLALTAHRYGDAERARVLVRNLEDGVKIDNAPDQSVLIGNTASGQALPTAYWGASGFWWRWHEGPIETTAFALQALVTIQPDHRLIEPAMNWLIKNRRGAQWSNTRDTAIAVLALNDYLKVTGELRNAITYEVTVNGQVIGTASEARRFVIEPSVLRDAQQEIRIRRTAGRGPLYFAAEARFVSLEEPVKAAGNELFVRRDYFRLRPRPTLLKGVQYDRVPIRDGDSIASGERVEVVISVETKNDYSYLMFEDLKPAGLEAVALQSGASLFATEKTKGGRSAFVYQELRDRKVALFIDHLQQGIWEMRYTMRAEVPGTFHALPVLGQAMYVPDIRGNGDEIRLTVTD